MKSQENAERFKARGANGLEGARDKSITVKIVVGDNSNVVRVQTIALH